MYGQSVVLLNDTVKFAVVGVHAILHEGWCTKESGTHFLGKTNWKKRWFKLVQTSDNNAHLQYYRFVSTFYFYVIICSPGEELISNQLEVSN